MVNTDYNQVFMAVDHWGQTVNLYVSDKTGQFYVESLTNVLNLKTGFSGGFTADVYEVRTSVVKVFVMIMIYLSRVGSH